MDEHIYFYIYVNTFIAKIIATAKTPRQTDGQTKRDG